MRLEANELLNIKGGASAGMGTIMFLVISGLISVLAGIFDGLTNPSKCQNS